jgi:beta-lactamase regulating signal transducer with metallopeptidase domain
MTGQLGSIHLGMMQSVGWTLIHFVWQGVVLAGVLAALLPMCRSASTRHNLSLATVVLMTAMPAMTFLFLRNMAMTIAQTLLLSTSSFHWNGLLANRDLVSAISAVASPAQEVLSESRIKWLVVVWFVGVVLLLLRTAASWHAMNKLWKRATVPLSADVLSRCHDLQKRLGITWAIRFFQSAYVSTPAVLGWLRPTVLVPVHVVAELPPRQLDALVAHELEHIRCFDSFSNILLIITETFLFFHPGVWWVAHRVRVERERRCDDLAVSINGDPATYIEAMTSLEKWRANRVPILAAAAGNLKNRAARLIKCPQRQDPRILQYSLASALFVAGYLVLATTTLSEADYSTSSKATTVSLDQEIMCPGASLVSTGCLHSRKGMGANGRTSRLRAAVINSHGQRILFIMASFQGGARSEMRVHCGWNRIRSLAVVACVSGRHRMATVPIHA